MMRKLRESQGENVLPNTWSLQYPLSIMDRTVRQKINETGRNTIKQLDLTDMQSTTQKQYTRSSQVQVGHGPG